MNKLGTLIALCAFMLVFSITTPAINAQATIYTELHSLQLDGIDTVPARWEDGVCIFPIVDNDPAAERFFINYTINGTFGNNITFLGPAADYIQYDTTVVDGNGVQLGNREIHPAMELTNQTISAFHQIYTNETNVARPFTLIFWDGDLELGSVTFDPATFVPDCATLPYVGPAQIADQFTGDDLQIFGGTDDNGNLSLNIYGINDDGEGYYQFSITQELLAPYVDNPPAQNTELASADNVTLYMLTTGEYQLNIGPDDEGKVRVIIFEGLPPTNVYSYDFNVYDVLGE